MRQDLDELGDRLRIIELNQPLVGFRIDAGLLQQRDAPRGERDELAMGEGVGDEIARGSLARQALSSLFREDERHGVEQDRRPAIDHVLRRDPASVRSFDAADFRRNDLHDGAFLLDR